MSNRAGKMKLSIKFKILIVFTITLLVATGLNLLFMSRILKENYVDVLNSELLTQANNLKSQLTYIMDLGISIKDVKGFDRICLDLVKKNKSLLDAMVIDADGIILFHSNPMFHNKKVKPAEIVQALRKNQSKLVGFSEENRNIYMTVIPVRKDAEFSRYGIVVSCPADIIDAKVLSLISRCNMFFLSTFGLAALLLLVSLTQILTKPLGIILNVIKDVSNSKTLKQHVDVKTEDEIGQIAAAFNKMTEDLQKSTTSIECLHEQINIRKTTEIQAYTARLEAEMANKMKSIFLANMSHEIRTPMNALMGFSEILCEENLSIDQKKYVNIILDNAQALLSLINDILDFSRIEAGRLQLEKAECSPSQLLENIYSTLSPLAASKGIEFKLILSPNLPNIVYTDPTRLRQCVVNLVSNAIKFTNHGHVYVRALVNSSDGQQQKFYVVVEDTGIGIPKENIGQLFDAFNQMDNRTAGQYGGTGLGLAITKQLVELMGGQISVVSDQGNGSAFTITLPLETSILSQTPQETSTSV
jgi:signal transduction histidine kinase